MSQAVVILALLHAKAGKEDEVGRRLSALVSATRQEPGAVTYDLHRSIDDPALWFVYEIYRSEEAVAAHMATPYLQSFLAAGAELLDRPGEIRKFAMVSEPVRR
jgi:quinol monooxygenase YgiN